MPTPPLRFRGAVCVDCWKVTLANRKELGRHSEAWQGEESHTVSLAMSEL